MPTPPSPGRRLLALWRRLAPLPFGAQLFAWVFGRAVPYSGALGALVRHLEPGRVRLELRDRRAVRNHLNSVHAVALANLGEMASGLAMTTALPEGARGGGTPPDAACLGTEPMAGGRFPPTFAGITCVLVEPPPWVQTRLVPGEADRFRSRDVTAGSPWARRRSRCR